MALLASTREATKGIREAMTRSRWPMGFLNVTPDGSVQQFLWNHSATEKGLEGMGVALRHAPSKSAYAQEVALMWKGRPWPKS